MMKLFLITFFSGLHFIFARDNLPEVEIDIIFNDKKQSIVIKNFHNDPPHYTYISSPKFREALKFVKSLDKLPSGLIDRQFSQEELHKALAQGEILCVRTGTAVFTHHVERFKGYIATFGVMDCHVLLLRQGSKCAFAHIFRENIDEADKLMALIDKFDPAHTRVSIFTKVFSRNTYKLQKILEKKKFKISAFDRGQTFFEFLSNEREMVIEPFEHYGSSSYKELSDKIEALEDGQNIELLMPDRDIHPYDYVYDTDQDKIFKVRNGMLEAHPDIFTYSQRENSFKLELTRL